MSTTRFIMEDPFHWPVPGRHQTMALQTIGPRDVGLMQKGLSEDVLYIGGWGVSPTGKSFRFVRRAVG